MSEPLSQDQLQEALAGLSGWEHREDALRKRFTFEDFRSAIAFIVRIGFEAETADHHPELTNVYNRVDVALTTHDAGDRVTKKDVDLAHAIDAVA